LVGYSRKIKAYKYYNLRLKKIVKIINVNIDETYVLKIKEERKNSKEREVEEELKEEELEERRRRRIRTRTRRELFKRITRRK
jgi:hypothetical protein